MYRLKYVAAAFIKYVSLLLGAFAALVPIVVVLFASFKTNKEYGSTSPLTPPENWLNFANYSKAFINGKMLLGFGNTVIIVVISILGATLIGSMIAYVLNRFKFRGNKLLMGAFLLATLIPSVTTQVATFRIINFFHLVDTRFAPILLYLGTDIIAVYIFHAIPRFDFRIAGRIRDAGRRVLFHDLLAHYFAAARPSHRDGHYRQRREYL